MRYKTLGSIFWNQVNICSGWNLEICISKRLHTQLQCTALTKNHCLSNIQWKLKQTKLETLELSRTGPNLIPCFPGLIITFLTPISLIFSYSPWNKPWLFLPIILPLSRGPCYSSKLVWVLSAASNLTPAHSRQNISPQHRADLHQCFSNLSMHQNPLAMHQNSQHLIINYKTWS